MTRVLPAWAASLSYLVIALLIGVAVGIAVAPMPKPMVLLTCPAPLLGALEANRIITMLTWRLSTRGGVHIYEVPNWKHNHTDSAAVQHTSAATQPGEASIIP